MRRVVLPLILLGGCVGEPEATLDADVVDECRRVCGTLVARGDAFEVISDADGVVAQGELDGRQRSFCIDGPLTPGLHALDVRVDGATTTTLSLNVRPFGWAYGLDRDATPLVAPPWTPVVGGTSDPPVLEGTVDGWDAGGVMSPALLRRDGEEILYYAGESADGMRLGLATRSGDGPFVKHPASPILAGDAAWKADAQNTPEPVVVGDEVWLYYNGSRDVGGPLSIGLATSSDGVDFSDVAENPVLAGTDVQGDWDGRGVAHPSVIVRDGVFELWYASGTAFAVGYALSADGVEFERYCDNPVFEGLGADSWDEGHIKAPEVALDGDTYFMSYSGCDKGCYQIGWAASPDGVRWTAAPEPVLPPTGGAAWNGVATREGYVEVDGATWTFVYTGNDGVQERIGRATAIR